MPVLGFGVFGFTVEEDTADERDCVEVFEWVVGIGDRKDEGDLVLESVESLLWFRLPKGNREDVGELVDNAIAGILEGGGGGS